MAFDPPEAWVLVLWDHGRVTASPTMFLVCKIGRMRCSLTKPLVGLSCGKNIQITNVAGIQTLFLTTFSTCICPAESHKTDPWKYKRAPVIFILFYWYVQSSSDSGKNRARKERRGQEEERGQAAHLLEATHFHYLLGPSLSLSSHFIDEET